MNTIKFYIQERAYFENCTVSDLYNTDGLQIGYALEDIGRPNGVKIDNSTCIPEGVYDASITFSNRFQKDMIQLSNTPERTVERDGVKFEGTRVHGGNTIADTKGCPLVAENFDGDDKIWASLSAVLTKEVENYIKQGHKVKWVITRK